MIIPSMNINWVPDSLPCDNRKHSVTWCIQLVQKTHDNMHQRQLYMHVHVVTLTGKRIIMHGDCWWKANCIMSSAWKQYCTVLTKLQWSHFDEKYTVIFFPFFFGPAKFHIVTCKGMMTGWLCALTCECRGSFVTSQWLLYGHCCPPQMKLAAGQGISVSSAALHGQTRSVGCNNCARKADTRAHAHKTVAAASQKSWNIHCLLRRYIHTNRRRLLRYQDQLRWWIWCSFLRDRGTDLLVCASHVLVCSGSHRRYHINKDNGTTKLQCFGSSSLSFTCAIKRVFPWALYKDIRHCTYQLCKIYSNTGNGVIALWFATEFNNLHGFSRRLSWIYLCLLHDVT